ncbi:hypothetical protein XENTR_v10005757 [Xenopus tropicalis]|nr:hypothetical protein XENTR_v10005757 [Xenopus tropicalis]
MKPTDLVKQIKLKISIFKDMELTNLMYSSQNLSNETSLYIVLEVENNDEQEHVLLVNSLSDSNKISATDFLDLMARKG